MKYIIYTYVRVHFFLFLYFVVLTRFCGVFRTRYVIGVVSYLVCLQFCLDSFICDDFVVLSLPKNMYNISRNKCIHMIYWYEHTYYRYAINNQDRNKRVCGADDVVRQKGRLLSNFLWLGSAERRNNTRTCARIFLIKTLMADFRF